MQALFYSILHFMTDGLCAFAMFSRFSASQNWFLYMVLYDFCAFVLQMPIGALMDRLKANAPEKAEAIPYFCAFAGCVLTIAGAFFHPVILGIGNAFFHVGGGIGTIEEDRRKGLSGQALGIFVAPGAMGLFLGTFFGKSIGDASGTLILRLFAALYLFVFVLFGMLYKKYVEAASEKGTAGTENSAVTTSAVIAAALCFIVVVIRSYAGTAVAFSWKTGFLWGFLCTLATVLGKMAGGILAARFGISRTMTVSLILASVCYYFSGIPAAGIAALFLFNMTMPITLYLITERFRGLEGFSFGLLTVALFLGVLPAFFGNILPYPGNIQGAAAGLFSLILLIAASGLLKKEKHGH